MRKSTFIFSIAILASAQTLVCAQETHQWTSASGAVWRDASGRCWRDASWSAATAVPGCDGAVEPQQKAPVAAKQVAPVPVSVEVAAAPQPAVVVVAKQVPVPAPVVAKAAPLVSKKITLDANAFFDTNKSNLKTAGKMQLDALAPQLNSTDISSVIATGYTDATGSDALNQKLSTHRAEAVKAYLVSKGVAASKIQAIGKGSSNPIADNKINTGRSKNRRVEIDVFIVQGSN
jgi:OOP family OmpA-OmpF porin